MILKLFLIAVFASIQLVAAAQEQRDTGLVRIETVDGNEFVGYLLTEDSVSIELKTGSLGVIKLNRSLIHKIEKVPNFFNEKGQYWFPNPQATRYFWAPNAYNLKAGEGYYQNIWVLWNQVAVGLSDNFSLGGGIIPLFLFSGGPTPVFLTTKLSLPVTQDRWNVGGGAFVGTVIGEESPLFGILYGNSTFGSRDKNVTVGVGGLFAAGQFASSPLLNISGMFRITSRGYILTENYFIISDSDALGIFSAGGRWVISKISLDYGVLIPTTGDNIGFIALPWLGLTIPFGKSR